MDAQHKSEIFYNSENKRGQDNRGVSKSYNDEHINQHILKDSLKIFKQNNPPSSKPRVESVKEIESPSPAAVSNAFQKNNSKSMPNVVADDNKPKPIFNRVQSSSSSSVDSSGDDDPGNQLVRLQKQK